MRLRQAMPFSDTYILGEYLSFGDFLLAAVAAIVLVWFVRQITKAKRFFGMTPEEYRTMQINRIIQRCYLLFPKTTFCFDGRTFKRGMLIRVTTRTQTFEGRLMGLNDDNVFCVLTQIHVAADILDNIMEIMELDE